MQPKFWDIEVWHKNSYLYTLAGPFTSVDVALDYLAENPWESCVPELVLCIVPFQRKDTPCEPEKST